MAPRKWQGARRRVKRFTVALAQGFAQQMAGADLRFLVEQIKAGIGMAHGSTAMEQKFTNRYGSGICDVLGAPAFHDTDARRNSAGLPDGVAVVGRTLVFVEFKPMGRGPTPAQRKWLERLAGVKYVWSGVIHPDEWAEFCDQLLAMEEEKEDDLDNPD